MNLALRFTECAVLSLEDQVHHLTDHSNQQNALARITGLIDAIESQLPAAPLAFPVSRQASELGVLHYREFNHDGFRVFYEIKTTEQAVVVLLVLRQKQSVEKALIRYCLLR
ncbi:MULTISPECIES: type II toxin-antitoxin system RelE/ParE family toxin [Pseudomonas]|uniref:Addiction module toxin RelE n=1 Tax=Pseudomonas oryzihabitans TaxID=47885 RepID=A0A178L6Q4_9PSED|nr:MULTISPECIES: type II toxin-antitoxin system RelE/ParE family toxin [Pseudomonas]NRH43953.1 type II toxin-antitoxin system RelE/ParE family toxin [Pseudomonas sp. MS15a(2019)]OAN24836.1 addiction module toxin RelE [Pseudomonas oryzihabitans]SEP11814.1 ParE toxin of type II toxin-antitoxin system, parDE [Pseudomonas sp. Snoq117.2]